MLRHPGTVNNKKPKGKMVPPEPPESRSMEGGPPRRSCVFPETQHPLLEGAGKKIPPPSSPGPAISQTQPQKPRPRNPGDQSGPSPGTRLGREVQKMSMG